MDGFGYTCALVLAAFFVRAGTAKLARPGATAASFGVLGVPGPAAAARTVPVIELVIAVLLLGVPRLGGFLAAGLLVAFTMVLQRAIKGGATAPCNCLGSISTDPVSPADMVRNGLLLLLALGAASSVRPEVPSAAAVAVAAATVGGGFLVHRCARSLMGPGGPAAITPTEAAG